MHLSKMRTKYLVKFYCPYLVPSLFFRAKLAPLPMPVIFWGLLTFQFHCFFLIGVLSTGCDTEAGSHLISAHLQPRLSRSLAESSHAHQVAEGEMPESVGHQRFGGVESDVHISMHCVNVGSEFYCPSLSLALSCLSVIHFLFQFYKQNILNKL